MRCAQYIVLLIEGDPGLQDVAADQEYNLLKMMRSFSNLKQGRNLNIYFI